MKSITQRRKKRIREVVTRRQKDLNLVINNIHDPHNVSAILRSCDAFGIPRIHLFYTVESFPVLGKKSSASAKKWVEMIRHADGRAMVETLKEKGFHLVRTGFSDRAVPVHSWNFTKPTAIVLGNEHRGVDEALQVLIPDEIYIPMMGMVQSLNVSVAAAVILYEAWRQRWDLGMYDNPGYSQEELEAMVTAWYRK